jgi:hypothetical protein
LEMYYHDQSLLPPSNKLGFIMTVVVGVVDNFSAELTHPYSVFINSKKVIAGFKKSKFIVTKKMVADEIKLSNKSCKLNMNQNPFRSCGRNWPSCQSPTREILTSSFLKRPNSDRYCYKNFQKLLAMIMKVGSG